MRPSVPFAILGVAALAAFGGYEMLKPNSATPPIQGQIEMKTYTNKNYGYSFQYPSTWHIEERLIESYNGPTEYHPELAVVLTNLNASEVEQELKSVSEHQRSWNDVAEGRTIIMTPITTDLQGFVSDETKAWVRDPFTLTESGATLDRMRYFSDFRLPPDIHYAFLPAMTSEMIDGKPIYHIQFSIDHEATAADMQTFEDLLKTVTYQ